MGWLFATALGLQERRAWGVLRALPPIALGHALAVAAVILVAGALAIVVPFTTLRVIAAGCLFAFAAYKIATRWRHPTWVGMRVGPGDLVLWSFLMALAHGAGLMLLPVLLHAQPAVVRAHPLHSATAALATASATTAAFAVALHTVALFAVMGTIALLAYGVIGVQHLRRLWINLDFIWGGALIIAGIVTLVR